MKNICKKVQVLLLSTLMLASCSNTESVLEETGSPINFNMPSLSRATFINSINDINEFGVWGTLYSTVNTSSSVQIYNGSMVEKNTSSETGWKCSTTQYWVPGAQYDFFAVYPYENNNVNSKDGNISINEYNITNQEDLIVAAQIDTNSDENNGIVVFNFHHTLARIEFTGKTDAVDATATLTGLKVFGCAKTGNCNWDGSISNNTPNIIWDITDGETTNADSPLYYNGNFNVGLVSTESDNLTGGILVIPQEFADKTIAINISYLMNGSTKNSTLYIPANTWEHGKSYKYCFTVKYNGYIEFTQPEVTLWGNATAGSIVVE